MCKLIHAAITLALIWRTVRQPAICEREEGQRERSTRTRFDPHDDAAQVPFGAIDQFQLIHDVYFEITDGKFGDNISAPTQRSGS